MKKIDLNTSILANNEIWAQKNRELFDTHGIFTVNMMSSPGSGKTTIIEKSLEYFIPHFKMGIIVGDIETTEDANRLKGRGVPVVQINTHGACHLDARMISGALNSFNLEELDLLIVENVGNLVCPADFSFGEDLKVAVLSTPEGNDKVRKYPDMFRKSHAVIINKIDLIDFVDFNLDRVERDLKNLGSRAEIFPMAASKGQGVEAWCQWLMSKVRKAN
ncbi:MAG: hydrogenase nickel incorporation protein HypB [Clostridia bacterium]|nr:hydrogenase nickel incorporation protein HypB [Clostridia bacterium]